MTARPIHSLASTPDLQRWQGIRPLGLPCPEHSSMTADDKCYYHLKVAHLQGQKVSLDGRQWCGFDEPQPDPPWRSHRGWRSAEDVMRSMPTDARDRYDEAIEDMRIVLSVGTTKRLEAER